MQSAPSPAAVQPSRSDYWARGYDWFMYEFFALPLESHCALIKKKRKLEKELMDAQPWYEVRIQCLLDPESLAKHRFKGSYWPGSVLFLWCRFFHSKGLVPFSFL